jgi:REP element-mobilizing transposase RayT
MKEHLKYPPARFEPACRISIGRGFANACKEFEICLLACAIGFDHVHIVAARHAKYSIEEMVQLLKMRATQAMNEDDTHPMKRVRTCPTPWSKGRWSVFIDDEAQLQSAIGYVRRHPQKEGLARQQWKLVTDNRR